MTVVNTPMTTNVVKFVDCCTGTEIFFRGVLSVIDGDVYSYIGTSPFVGFGGSLVTNGCYTVYAIYISEVSYPIAPTIALLTEKVGCNDVGCIPCTEPVPCECPKDYIFVDGDCVKETSTSATYSGELLTLIAAGNNTAYCDFGLRLYPDITSMIWPVLGDGSSDALYTVNQNNGSGPLVTPIGNVQNEVWGKGTAPCYTGSTGGRLNIAGVWNTLYPADTELAFEFCITVEGPETKQYMIGIAGDNYVKFYIDNVLAVFLNAGNAFVSIPFRYWHAFPITLSPGTHTIKLAGLNFGATPAAFAAEIYDITLSQFQASLMTPAVSAGNCGTSPATLEPYILFSTRSMVGRQVANPSTPGRWTCPEDTVLDLCNGIPSCKFTDIFPLECTCYLLIPCDGTTPFVTNQDLSLYVNDFIGISSDPYDGIVYVVSLDGNTCEESVLITIDDPLPVPCDLTCYYVQNSNGVLYVDSTNQLQEISSIDAKPFIKICSRTYPLVQNNSSNYLIVDLGPCNPLGDLGCPKQCYKLVSCTPGGPVIYTNSDSVLPYLYGTNNVVEIAGRSGCWTVENLDPLEVCDCPIDVIVTSSYADCAKCIGYISYKLTNCNGTDVIYTLDDLSDYLESTIKTDCGCYTVEQLDVLPPNVQTIVVDYEFNSCVECLRTYWKLEDCDGIADDIYTYSDLSTYEDKFVKLENCNTCWEVTFTEAPINAITVNVVLTFDECIECSEDLPCVCSTVTNNSALPRTYEYLDCDFTLVTITVQPGETSRRACIIKWNNVPITDYVEYFGDCTNKVCPPFVIKTVRTVVPGYNTPACTPERYDEITCHFADIMYKVVLEKRYGISNCCPDDDEKWLLLKELIDLQALKDPDYDCPTCPCSCNSGKTKSSCNCGN